MLAAVRPVYTFGPFHLDPAERRLVRDGQPVAVPPKSLDVLTVLVEQAGHLVTKEALLGAVWPEAVVEENALIVAVSRLRAVLEDRGRQGRYIETVTGHGYRFVAPVTEEWTAMGGGDSMPPVEPVVAPPPARASVPVAPVRARWDRRRWGALFFMGGLAVLATALAWQGGREAESGSPSAMAAVDPVESPALPRSAALEAYQRGLAAWASRDGNAMLGALTNFKLAAHLDPTFALAYLGQAQVYATNYQMEAEAEVAIRRALALDSTLAAAWATRGFVRAFHTWDWAGADAAFEHARAIDPDDITTLQWLASLRMVQRRLPEAEALLRRALVLAPEYAPLHADLCELLYYRRAYDDALATCDRALALDFAFPFALQHRAWIAIASGQHAEAARFLGEMSLVLRYSPLPDSLFDWRNGPAALERYLRWQVRTFLPTTDHIGRARAYAALGELDSALTHVEQAVTARAFLTPFLHPDPLFDPVRDDPRWQAAIRRTGLSP